MNRSLFAALVPALALTGLVGFSTLGGACVAATDESSETGASDSSDDALVAPESIYTTSGWLHFENEYVPRVCTAENGNASYEALKAQAIAARTYVLRAMRDEPSLGKPGNPVENGQHFQAFAGSSNDGCRRAAAETRGQVARYAGQLIIANYVAGAIWTGPAQLGNDPTHTEKWVTYNDGRRGGDVRPTALSHTARSDNRGCMSQNGANWLGAHGYDYTRILRYFYGADMELAGEQLGPDGCTDQQRDNCGNVGCGCADGQCSGGYACEGNGCSAAQTAACGGFGCGCVDGECSGGYCPGTGCSAKRTRDCGGYGVGCVDMQCEGGFGPGDGCTAKEETDCGKFGCGCVDHQCSGGACEGSGCTARQTEDCGKFGCGCEDGQCAGGACE